MADEFTAGQVAARLGIKAGMVRRYALALEAVTGVSIPTDPVRGRLYPTGAVDLLEAARAYLLAHPGESVDGALRVITGQSDGRVTAPARVPGALGPADLEEALRGVLLPVLAELQEQRRENEALRLEVAEIRAALVGRQLLVEVEGLRAQVARLEVVNHAALPAPAADQGQRKPGLLSTLLVWLNGR